MPFDSTNFVKLSVRDQRALRVIQKMRALIGSPDRWTQGAYERNDRFCLIGALNHTTADLSLRQRVAGRLARIVRPDDGETVGYVVIAFNDNKETKHQDVLTLLDRAMTTGGSDAV